MSRISALILLALLLPVAANADPAVSAVSGTFSHGGTVTISGTGFGDKSPAKPQVWAPFDGGSVAADATLSSGSLINSSSYYEIDATSNPHSNSTYSVSNIAMTNGDKTAADLRTYVSSGSGFMFMRRKFPSGLFAQVTNGKFLWWWPTPPDGSTCTGQVPGYVNMIFDYLSAGGYNMNISYQGGSQVQPTGYTPPDSGAWQTWEVQAKKGTANNYDGVHKWWVDGTLRSNRTNILNVTTAYPKDTFCTFLVQDFWTNTAGGGRTFWIDNAKDYVDDLYIDTTWSRVMIGNASTYDASTHREPLIPTAWTATEITAYFNQGSFGDGETVYVFVVDSNGVASPGKLITISGTQVDATGPYVDNVLPAPSSTGVLETNRTISFDVNDTSNVSQTNGSVVIEGEAARTCGSGLTCTGNGTTKLRVVYTKGSDWTPGQVVDVSISGFKDQSTNANTMTAYSYSYTIRSAPTALNIDTTSPMPAGVVSTAYSQSLSISGGTSPYTCSTPTGAWPTGLTLSPSCVVSGTPTLAGVFTANAMVTDYLSATDNQDLSITIAAAPGGGGGASDTGDTFVNINALSTNYADNTYLEVYTYPANTVANRILDNVAFTLPANATIKSATLRLYMIGTDGAGGDATMRLYVYPVTGMPAINLVTWQSFDDNAATLGAAESFADVTKSVGWAEWSVTNMVQAAYAASTNLFLAIDGAGTSSADTSRQFASSQYATESVRPQLVIVYTVGTDTPPSPTISAPGKYRASKMKGTFK